MGLDKLNGTSMLKDHLDLRGEKCNGIVKDELFEMEWKAEEKHCSR